MKRFSFKDNAQKIIFFLIIALTLGIVVPVYNGIFLKLKFNVDGYKNLLKEKTGLELSYQSMSPSLLTGIKLNQVSLVDSFTGKEVCAISVAQMQYNFIDLIKGKSFSAIKDISIDGINIDLDENGNSLLFQKILSLSSGIDENSSADEKNDFNVKEIVDLLSMKLLVKNVRLNYANSDGKAVAVIKKLQFVFQNMDSIIFVNASGFFKWNSFIDNSYVGCNLYADGKISQELNGSSLTLTVNDLETQELVLSKLNMLLMFDDGSVSLQTIHNSYPLLLIGKVDTQNGKASASLKTKHLRYGDIVKSKKNNAGDKFQDFDISIQADLDYDFTAGNFFYSSFGNIFVPSSVVRDGALVDYEISGDLKKLSIAKLNVEGRNINAQGSLDFEFEKLGVQGDAILYNWTMDNGAVISGEVYFDSLEEGFVCFAPQILLDQQVLTAMQLQVVPSEESFDITFEVSDYSHQMSDEPGKINIDASFMKSNKYVQANVSAHALYVDSIVQKALLFTEERNYQMASVFKNFMMNGEVYFSSDIESMSFNVPYIVVADTSKSNKYLFLSLDGNSTSLNISKFSYISDGNTTSLQAQLEKAPDSKEAFFTIDVNSVSIPYHFSGNIMENYVSLYGDYDFAFELNFVDGFSGKLSTVGFPVQKDKTIFGISFDSVFNINNIDDFLVSINKIEIEEVSDTLSVKPHLLASGSVSKYGAVFDSISYSDKISTMYGTSKLLWNIHNGIFDSAGFDFSISSENNREKMLVKADVFNPMAEKISVQTIMSSLFWTAQINCVNFNLSRIGGEKSLNNGLTGTVSMSGTLEDPYIGLDIEKIEFMMMGKLIKASMKSYLEDKKVVVDSATFEYNNFLTKDISAVFDLRTWSGKAGGTVHSYVSDRSLVVPFSAEVFDSVIEEGNIVPSEFIAKLDLPDVHGTLLKNPFALGITVLKTKDRMSIFSSKELGLSGTIENDGEINLQLNSPLNVFANIVGYASTTEIQIDVVNIKADFGSLFQNVDLDAIAVTNGFAKGAVKVQGMLSDPEFVGALSINDFDFSMPKIIPSNIFVKKTLITIDNKEVILPATRGLVKNTYPIYAKMNIFFDRWDLDFVKGRVWTEKNEYVPADLDTNIAEFKGDAYLNLDLFFQDEYLDISGQVNVRKTHAWIKTSELAEGIVASSENSIFEGKQKSFYNRFDLKVTLEDNVRFTFDPLLRVVFVPNSVVLFKYDEADDNCLMDGVIRFKTGDVSYLNRNFYLKSGLLRFNKTDSVSNPQISVQAETRERDENGDNILIILSATNQYLSDFEPVISSIPAKSELEIRQILGQIVMADSDNIASFLVATGDYALQSTVGRAIEGKLRDLFNFDILSIRTMILQNALKQSLFSEKDDKNSMKIGNFLDNSTVYIGKYFGSSLYVDALLHWSYDENRLNDSTTTGGLVFKPELGLEIESPFANIRWNMAPDIDALMKNRIVTSTSVTLSWKFAF